MRSWSHFPFFIFSLSAVSFGVWATNLTINITEKYFEEEFEFIHQKFIQVEKKIDILTELERLYREPRQPVHPPNQSCKNEGGDSAKDLSSQLKYLIVARKSLDNHHPIKAVIHVHPVLIIVAAPESSGNRYTVDVFVKAAGCFGHSGHKQPFDQKGKPRQKNWSVMDGKVLQRVKKTHPCAVLHRSYPHNNIFVDMEKMAKQARDNGFDPRVVVITRYEEAVESSQLKHKHVSRKEKARENFYRSYLDIFRHIIIARLPYVLITYELLEDPIYVEWMFNEIGISYDKEKVPPFNDANKKYLAGRK